MKPFRFGIIGEYQSGKSLLVNCILHRSIATVGVGNATTHTIVNYIYSTKEHVVYRTVDGDYKTIAIENLNKLDTETNISEIDVYLSNEVLKDFIVTDMPGFGANIEDNIVARKTLRSIDFAILISSNDKVIGSDTESFHELKELQVYNIPYYFILNCTNTDWWRCDDERNIDIAQKDLKILDSYKPSCYPLKDDKINIVNLMWYWYSICNEDDKLINRTKNNCAFNEYEITPADKKDVGDSSNYELINRLFSMDNKMYLELKRELREEINRLKKEVCPIGTIQAFAYNSIPQGWLLCDGTSVSISEYRALYEAIGTTFGGDGEDYFCIPDLRGRFVRGFDNSGEIDKNREFGSLQDDSFQSHSHSLDASKIKVNENGRHYHPLWCDQYDTVTSVFGLASSSTSKRMCYPTNTSGSGKTDLGPYAGDHTHLISILEPPISSPTQDGTVPIKTSTETRPKNIAMLYCIKCI